MGFLIRFLVSAAALWVAVWWIDGFTFDGEWWQFLIVTLIMGVVNAIVKPIIKLFSLPLIILTLGLFLLVTNALALQLTVWLSDSMDLGLASEGFFWTTFLAAIVISVVAWLLEVILPDGD